MVTEHHLPITRVCTATGLSRAAYYKVPPLPQEKDAEVIDALNGMVERNGRWGFWKCFDQSSCESGPRAGYDDYKRRNGSKVHMAVDTLGTCWPCMSRRPMSKSARKCSNYARRCKRPRAKALKWLGLIKATQAKTLRISLQEKASTFKSSNCPKPKKALCCYLAAGLWSAVSDGWLAFDA